jgi:hypothetical protein
MLSTVLLLWFISRRCRYVNSVTLTGRFLMNWKGFGRKRSSPDGATIAELGCRGQMNAMETPVKRVPAEIRAERFPMRVLERYRYVNPLGGTPVMKLITVIIIHCCGVDYVRALEAPGCCAVHSRSRLQFFLQFSLLPVVYCFSLIAENTSGIQNVGAGRTPVEAEQPQ